MRIPGNLRSTTLGDVLGTLHRGACSGTLELVESRSGRSHRVHLTQGLVERVETELPVARLGEILRAEGLVSKHVLEWALKRMRPGRAAPLPFGQVLLGERVVTQDMLAAALRHQLKRRLDSLFALKDASVRFRVPRPRPCADKAIPLSPREFLFGRPRSRLRRGARDATAVAEPAPERQRALRKLGLDAGATPTEIHQTFRVLAQQTHPDRFANAESDQKKVLMTRFAELSAAYHVLMR